MDKRFFIALLLSLVVVAVSQFLFPFGKKSSDVVPGRTLDSLSTSVKSPLVTPAAQVGQPPMVGPTSVPPAATPAPVEAKITTFTLPKAIYRFSSVGAAPVSIVMRDYANHAASQGLVDLATPNSRLLGFRLIVPGDTISLENVAFSERESTAADGAATVTYSASVGGHAVTISYALTANPYVLKVSGTVADAPGGSYVLTSLPGTIRPAEADTVADQRSLGYVFKRINDRPGSVLFSKLDPGEKQLQTGPLEWVAVKNKYFVVGLFGEPKPLSEVTLVGGARTSKVATLASATVVQALQQGRFQFRMYAGPQETRRLIAMGHDFDHVNPYGWKFLQPVVHPVASLVIQLLLWMHSTLRLSYGWVLVILGLAVRLVLWPLNQSTMRSTLRMQSVQPKLAAVQKKYKDDPRKQQEAIMKVYQEEGISPLAPLMGCLPALLPMPIFFALFFVFQNTIAFRGVPFLWLHDLSVKDPLYVIPLLMGASMYLLSWIGMRNAPPNPQTKMMSYMFPAMMTVFLINMASGLNLYYTAQNLAALPQQWLIARERLKAQPRS